MATTKGTFGEHLLPGIADAFNDPKPPPTDEEHHAYEVEALEKANARLHVKLKHMNAELARARDKMAWMADRLGPICADMYQEPGILPLDKERALRVCVPHDLSVCALEYAAATLREHGDTPVRLIVHPVDLEAAYEILASGHFGELEIITHNFEDPDEWFVQGKRLQWYSPGA